jgi:hypothetical protein
MRRNWNEIRKIPCRESQIALATCQDPKELSRLQAMYPTCFEEGEEGTLARWSVVVRTAIDTFARDARGVEPDADYAYTNWQFFKPYGELFCLRFGIDGDSPQLDGKIPIEIAKQLRMIKEITGPVILSYLGCDWIVCEARCKFTGGNSDAVDVMMYLSQCHHLEKPNDHLLALVLKDSIDINA